MRPTLKMIAEYAGVSRGTVDRVLHGRPKVHPDKRRRVEEALKKFDYTPNAAARSLALASRNIAIGVLLPPWGPYYRRELTRGIETAKANLRDYSLSVFRRAYESDSAEDCLRAVDEALERGAKGLAVCAANTLAVRRRLLDLSRDGLPVVTFNSDVPDSGQLCFVGQDDVKSGRIAAELLCKLLPRDAKIVLACNNLEYASIRDRVDGFRARTEELGLRHRDFPILETYDRYDVTHRKVLEFVKANPDFTGLYMVTESTIGAVAALRQAKRLPGMRVVSHDLPDTTVKAVRDGAVDFTVDQNVYYQGLRPVSIIADFLLTGKRPDHPTEFTPSTIICAENLREDKKE